MNHFNAVPTVRSGFKPNTAAYDAHDSRLEALKGEISQDAHVATEKTGGRLVEFARSYGRGFRPPVRGSIWGSGARPKHQGKWSDIKGDLMKGYRSDTKGGPNPTGRIYNDAEHAKWVERMADFWVVKGLATSGRIARDLARSLKEVTKRKKVL